MAVTYGRKFSIALFASFMLTLLSSIDHHQVACYDIDEEGSLLHKQKVALFNFFQAVKASKDVNWNMESSVCDWKGITCEPSGKKNAISWLRLPGKSLIGQIRNDTIGNVDVAMTLTKLSLRHNGLTGPVPSDFNKLTHLVQFSLQNNKFSGQLPEDLYFPNIINDQFNVSNNNFSGYIPHYLSSFKDSSFTQNFNLCGPPLTTCPFAIPIPPLPSTASPKNKNKLPTGAIVGIAIGSPLLFLFLLSCLRKDINMQPHNTQVPIRSQNTPSSSKDKFMAGETSKLVIFEKDGIYSKYCVEDLLRASAEILGKGRIGTTYKALMKEGEVVVIKRLELDDAVVTKEDFKSRMEILGKMKNENVVPLRAYHCSEVEKLLVFDYFPAGSVHDLLHGSRGSGQISLDWEERMGIALSAAKGLAYLHVSEKLVHGNFKSSNILLRQGTTNKEAFVSDYGLNIPSKRSNFPIVTMNTDVYSFGIFLLELLTRKVPNQKSLGEEGFDLPRLFQLVPQEEWKAKVFDTELMRHQNRNVEEEMVRLLEIAMLCVSFVPNQQPTMGEVVIRMMKDMNRDTLSIVTQ